MAVSSQSGDGGFLAVGLWGVALGGCGKLWKGALGCSGKLWEAVEGTGTIWEALGGCGKLWGAVGGTGTLWEALEGSGKLWEALGGSGRFWEANRPRLGGPATTARTAAPPTKILNILNFGRPRRSSECSEFSSVKRRFTRQSPDRPLWSGVHGGNSEHSELRWRREMFRMFRI